MGSDMKHPLDFSGKSVLITGSSTGIGREAALLFAGYGARVAVNSVSGRGETISATLRAKGYESIFLQGDVADTEACRSLVREAVKAFGSLDILVNNAGVVPTGMALDTSEAEFDRAIAVNVKGTFFLSRYAIEQMRNQGGGTIINVGSIAGLIGPRNRAAYSATKGAIISMSRALAADHAQDQIRINCICPGMVMTDSLRERINIMEHPEEAQRHFEVSIPQGRIGSALEAAMMILMVASDSVAFMTGSVLTIDGGTSL